METPIIDAGFIKQIKQLIANELLDDLRGQLAHIYAQDVADLLDKLDTNEARQIMLCIDAEKAVKVLIELDEDVRINFLATYNPNEIATTFVQFMDSDDAAYVLNHLPIKEQEEVISQLTDIEFASNLLSLMSYEEYTAGSLMAVELVKANAQ